MFSVGTQNSYSHKTIYTDNTNKNKIYYNNKAASSFYSKCTYFKAQSIGIGDED